MRITEKNFRWVIRNIFYTGYITGNLVDYKLIPGKHPPLVDMKTFLKANDLLDTAPTVGIVKEHKHEELPLKVFAKDSVTNIPLTGYKTKDIWYYKNQRGGSLLNVNANTLNFLFSEKLKTFEYRKIFKSCLQKEIQEGIKQKKSENIGDKKILKKKITEIRNSLEKLEERFIREDVSKDLYEKYQDKYNTEIVKLESELAGMGFQISNLENLVKKGLEIAGNLSQMWVSSDFTSKQRIQRLVFPEVIVYDKKNMKFELKK